MHKRKKKKKKKESRETAASISIVNEPHFFLDIEYDLTGHLLLTSRLAES